MENVIMEDEFTIDKQDCRKFVDAMNAMTIEKYSRNLLVEINREFDYLS